MLPAYIILTLFVTPHIFDIHTYISTSFQSPILFPDIALVKKKPLQYNPLILRLLYTNLQKHPNVKRGRGKWKGFVRGKIGSGGKNGSRRIREEKQRKGKMGREGRKEGENEKDSKKMKVEMEMENGDKNEELEEEVKR